MNRLLTQSLYKVITLCIFALSICLNPSYAQRIKHAPPNRGAKPVARPGNTRPTINGGAKVGTNRPKQTVSNRPNTRPVSNTRPAAKRPVNNNNNRPSTVNRPGNNNTNRPTINNRPGNNNNNRPGNVGNNRPGNNNRPGGNKVNINIDNSKHIDIHNRNTIVRHNHVNMYHRPPYHYGGFFYYSFHPFYYHPYRPFIWGPVWHPWGFFAAALTATAIIVAIDNIQYHYDQGVWYEPYNNGYTAVPGPVGGQVNNIPSGAETVVINQNTYNYYGGTYYEKEGTQYMVVAPPAGAVVQNLPEGGEEVKIGDQTYVRIGETYYLPVMVDGKEQYEIAQIENE